MNRADKIRNARIAQPLEELERKARKARISDKWSAEDLDLAEKRGQILSEHLNLDAARSVDKDDEMNDWRPIETAPKNGTTIMVKTSEGWEGAARWLTDLNREIEPQWCLRIDNPDDDGMPLGEPIMWKPLRPTMHRLYE